MPPSSCVPDPGTPDNIVLFASVDKDYMVGSMGNLIYYQVDGITSMNI